MSTEEATVRLDEPLPENSQDLVIFVQTLLDQMVLLLCLLKLL